MRSICSILVQLGKYILCVGLKADGANQIQTPSVAACKLRPKLETFNNELTRSTGLRFDLAQCTCCWHELMLKSERTSASHRFRAQRVEVASLLQSATSARCVEAL